ncbi:MAG: hypothetical protein JWS08_03250 [Phormidium sp. PBR-2020]|nr:MAG: hypothetical protein JWS08_03250 [Phormidium sp. PBR-2020]
MTGSYYRFCTTGEATVTTVAFAPDGETWAIADAEGQVSLWTGEDGPDQTIAAHESWILGLSFHPDGDRFATASRDGTIKLWSRQTGTRIQTLSPQDSGITSLAFSPDGGDLSHQ